MLHPERIAGLYRDACHAELDALKVGNVHAYAAGHRMEVADFARSAEVSAGPLAEAGSGVGARVLGGVAATREAVGQNTNLGILLLCAPLALAAEEGITLAAALGRLGPEDAMDVFAAIRLASPGGLGQATRYDVTAEEAEPPPLSAAMAEAAPRDRIARAYVTAFEDVREVGLPALEAARAEAKAADDALDARIAVLEAHKIIIGAYTGNGVQLRFVDVGYEVQAVFVQSRGMTPHFTVKDHECSPVFYVEGSGFRVGTNNVHTLNTEGRLYYYVAVV